MNPYPRQDTRLNLDSLNEQQRAAVLCKDGPVLIVAGAGSGKTRVLTYRIASLLEDGVAPERILALTFTRKAAEEMRKRIRTLAGDGARNLVMGTFHSVFARFLREWHAYVGFPSDFTIYDTEDSQKCLQGVIGELLFGPKWNDKEAQKLLSAEEKKERKRLLAGPYKTKDVASRISLLKNDIVTPKDYLEDESRRETDFRKGRDRLGDIYKTYMERCHRAAAMDFDDLLLYTYMLVSRSKDAYNALSSRFDYILVDEFQDTNAIQYSITSILASRTHNICAVGDDSQSIYAFRGARIKNILDFRNDYRELKTFRLEANYRSTSQIVEAANRLIEYNRGRLPKVCWASRGEGCDIRVEFLRNDRAEARFIAKSVKLRHSKGSPWSDNAVLYRTNAQSRALEEAFLQEKIPYVIYSGMSFYERMEIKDVLAYMRLIVNPADEEAFKRVCNKPARGISEATLTALAAVATRDDKPLYEVAADIFGNPCGLKPKAHQAAYDFTQLIDGLRTETAGMDAYEAAKVILEKSGIYTLYQSEADDQESVERLANIHELMNGISYFIDERTNGDEPSGTSLTDYLENIALLSNTDRTDADGDRVALMTSHSSKGLEFKTVFVAGVEEGLYPAVRYDSTEFELEEERRLFYVSITRAKDELVLTSCEERWRYGETFDCTPSRFLKEIFGTDDEENEDD